MKISHGQYLLVLTSLFTIEWIVLAIDPLYRDDWAMENVLVIVAVVVLASVYRKSVLSKTSYTLIFIFLCLHEIGAHFTYSEVPYDLWFRNATGYTFSTLFNWERNNFDRVIHLCYGLLLTCPIREILLRFVNVAGFLSYLLPLALTMASSMVYEFIEWAVVELFYQDLGMAYLGTQGDIWDGHKDMALASLGGLMAMLIAASLSIFIGSVKTHD